MGCHSKLGFAHFRAGDAAAAAHCFGQAAAIFREVGQMPYLAVTFTSLADVEAVAGDAAAASRSRAVAGAVLDALPPSDAGQVRAWITRQAEPPPAVALAADVQSPAEQ